MKVVIEDGNIVRMSKDISRSEYSATYIGITRFSRRIAPVLFSEIGSIIREGRVHEFYNVAVQQLVDRGLPVRFTSTRGLPWAEVDNEADLQFARTAVYPRLRPLYAEIRRERRSKAAA